MAAASTRTITIGYTGDVTGTETVPAAANAASPASVTLHTLSAGANTITPPSGTTAATILPPTGNVQTLTLKGITGDTGVPLHLTDPSSIALATSPGTFVLTVGGTITGLRIFWS